MFFSTGESQPLLCCRCCSVTNLCPTHCYSMDSSAPAFRVLHCHPGLAQTHVHWVSDAIQPPHSLSSPSLLPQSFQNQGLFQWVGSSHQVAKVQGWFPLGLTGLISLLSRGLLSLLQHHNWKTSVLQCSAFFMVQLVHPHMTTGKTIALTTRTFVSKAVSLI